jgi:hypothetical protein
LCGPNLHDTPRLAQVGAAQQDPYSKGAQLKDYFQYDWTTRRYQPNTLGAGAPADG